MGVCASVCERVFVCCAGPLHASHKNENDEHVKSLELELFDTTRTYTDNKHKTHSEEMKIYRRSTIHTHTRLHGGMKAIELFWD